MKPTKYGGELRYSGRVSSSCSTSDTTYMYLDVLQPRLPNFIIFFLGNSFLNLQFSWCHQSITQYFYSISYPSNIFYFVKPKRVWALSIQLSSYKQDKSCKWLISNINLLFLSSKVGEFSNPNKFSRPHVFPQPKLFFSCQNIT